MPKLEAYCTSCDATYPDSARFCGSCGEKLIIIKHGFFYSKPRVHNRIDIGGWLLFFCLYLTFLVPLATLFSYGMIWALEIQLTRLAPLTDFVMVVYGIVIGAKIWNGNKNGRFLAKEYLLIRLSVVVVFWLYTASLLQVNFWEAEVAFAYVVDFFYEAMHFGVWYTYFKVSKRVAATYSSPSSFNENIDPVEICQPDPDLKRRYAAMPDEEFGLLRRADLRPLAQEAYDREVERRSSSEKKAGEVEQRSGHIAQEANSNAARAGV